MLTYVIHSMTRFMQQSGYCIGDLFFRNSFNSWKKHVYWNDFGWKTITRTIFFSNFLAFVRILWWILSQIFFNIFLFFFPFFPIFFPVCFPIFFSYFFPIFFFKFLSYFFLEFFPAFPLIRYFRNKIQEFRTESPARGSLKKSALKSKYFQNI